MRIKFLLVVIIFVAGWITGELLHSPAWFPTQNQALAPCNPSEATKPMVYDCADYTLPRVSLESEQIAEDRQVTELAQIKRGVLRGDKNAFDIQIFDATKDCHKAAALHVQMGSKYDAWAMQRMVDDEFYNSNLTSQEAAQIYAAKVVYEQQTCACNEQYANGQIDPFDHDTLLGNYTEEYETAVDKIIGTERNHDSPEEVGEGVPDDLMAKMARLRHFAGAWNLSEGQIVQVHELLKSIENYESEGEEGYAGIDETDVALHQLLGDNLYGRLSMAGIIEISIRPEVVQSEASQDQ